MPDRVTLSPVGNPENSSFVTELNAALDTLADEFDVAIYADGDTPMSGDLDMNSRRIYNLPFPVDPTEPMRYGDVADFQGTPGVDGVDGADAEPPNFTFDINTGAAGTDALLNVTGTYPDLLLDFTIPRGLAGASGALTDGTYSGIVVSGTGTALDVAANHITFARLADLSGAGVIGGTAAGDPGLLSFATVKSNLALVKGDVGLGNVDNTSDAGKPVSTATQTALDLKAPLSPRVQSVASSATVTPTFLNDAVKITAQAEALNLANPTGTEVDMHAIAIRIKDNGTARAITYGTQYRAVGVTLPVTTVLGKTLYLGMIFNDEDTKWDVVAVAQEA